MERLKPLGSIEQQQSTDSTETEHINIRIGNVDRAGKIKKMIYSGTFGEIHISFRPGRG